MERTKVASGFSKGWRWVSENNDWVVRLTNRVLLLARKLTWCLEIDAKIGEVAFVVFADILYCVDMEGNRKPMDGQNNCLSFAVHEYLNENELA